LTPEQLEKGFRILTKAAVEADARRGNKEMEKGAGGATVQDGAGQGVAENN